MTYNKEYYEQHRDRFREYNKRYVEKKIDDGTYDLELEKQRERLKKYYATHKEQFSEYSRSRSDLRKEKIECECGTVIARGSKSIHRKTEKHTTRMIIKDLQSHQPSS